MVAIAHMLALLLALLPGRFVLELMDLLRLRRAKRLLTDMEPLPPREQLEFLLRHASARWVPVLLKHRHVAVVIALNIPGNAIIGGGGGISLAAGFSRLFSTPAYILTVGVAVAPFPLAVWITGG